MIMQCSQSECVLTYYCHAVHCVKSIAIYIVV